MDLKNCAEKNSAFITHAIGATSGSYRIFLGDSTQSSKKSRKGAMKDLMEINTTVLIEWTNAPF